MPRKDRIAICSREECRKGFNFCWRSKADVEPKSAPQQIVSLSFLVTLFPWVKSEQWLKHYCITPSKVIQLFCNTLLFWLTMFHLLILLENISWTLLQLLNVDHGFFKGDLMSWQQNSGCITAHSFVKNLNVANDASEHAFNLLTTFNMGKLHKEKSSKNICGALPVCCGKHYMKLRHLIKEWQSNIFKGLGSTWIFSETIAKKVWEKLDNYFY